MIQEKLEHKKIGSIIGVLYVLMIVASIFALYIFVNFVAYLTKLPWLVYVLYAILIIGATLIIRKRLTDYSYGIAHGELILDRQSSRNPKNLLTIPVKSILWFGNCSDVPAEYAKIRPGKVTFLKANVSKTVIFKRDKFTHGVMFTPSEKFTQHLIERMEKAKKKQKTSESKHEECEIKTPESQSENFADVSNLNQDAEVSADSHREQENEQKDN